MPGAGRLLVDCCAAYDIEIEPGPGALVQAVACASLLAAYVQGSPLVTPWTNALDRAELSAWPRITAATDAEWVQRDPSTPGDEAPAPSFLARAAVKLPDYTGPEEHLDYLALLDLCLLDHVLSPQETRELRVLAEFSGVTAAEGIALHRRYFEDLVQVAWLNGALSVADSISVMKISRSIPLMWMR